MKKVRFIPSGAEELNGHAADEQLNRSSSSSSAARGDLTWRKLVPALYNLSRGPRCRNRLRSSAVDRVELSDEHSASTCATASTSSRAAGQATATSWKNSPHIRYLRGDFNEARPIRRSGRILCELGKGVGDRSRTASSTWPRRPPCSGKFRRISARPDLARRPRTGAHRGREANRPRSGIGPSAEPHVSPPAFDESQIFRIDHYLGKETVQNILAFRFANPLFEPIWNRRYVDHVTITVAEDGGRRAPRRLLRTCRRTARHGAEPPDATALPGGHGADGFLRCRRDPQQEGRRAARHPPHSTATRSTHRGSRPVWPRLDRSGKKVRGYREEAGVPPDSQTETFAALKLFVDNWRWQDVPFYLRTGKRLPGRSRRSPSNSAPCPTSRFRPRPRSAGSRRGSILSIQPEEGIVLGFQAKYPGPRCCCGRWTCVSLIARAFRALAGCLRDAAVGRDE